MVHCGNNVRSPVGLMLTSMLFLQVGGETTCPLQVFIQNGNQIPNISIWTFPDRVRPNRNDKLRVSILDTLLAYIIAYKLALL